MQKHATLILTLAFLAAAARHAAAQAGKAAPAPAPAAAPAAGKTAAAPAEKADKAEKKGPDFGVPGVEETDEVLKASLEGAKAGDMREFRIVTDDDLTDLTEGDIYKNNTSFFKITRIRASGKKGGRFTAVRTNGDVLPGRAWERVSGVGPAEIKSRETLFARYMSGGSIMHPILLLFVATFAIAVSNSRVYRRHRQCPQDFVSALRAAISKGDVENFGQLAIAGKGLLATICRAMVVDYDISNEEDIRIRAESEARRQVGALRMPLRALNFMAAVAPLLGLLGTVIGMVMCFEALADQAASAAKSQQLAAGIKVALLTTVAGLLTAIPALFFYFVFNQKLSNVTGEVENYATEFVHRLGILKRKAE